MLQVIPTANVDCIKREFKLNANVRGRKDFTLEEVINAVDMGISGMEFELTKDKAMETLRD